MTMQATRQQQVEVKTAAIDAKSIRSIELPSGWTAVRDCELTQFAVGDAHSPISPAKLYPTLSYRNESGSQVFTPLSAILSFSEDDVTS